MIGIPARTSSRMCAGRVTFSSGSAGPITSNAMLSAPTAATFFSASHLEPAALTPAARRYSSGLDQRAPYPVRTSTTSPARTSTRAARRRSEAVRGRRRAPSRAIRGARGSISVAVNDPSAREVIRGELDADPVAGRDADEVPTHASGRVSDQLVAAFDLNLEHRVRQRERNDRVHDDGLLFRISVVAEIGRASCRERV